LRLPIPLNGIATYQGSTYCLLSSAFRSSGVNAQFFFGKELQQAVAFHIDSVSEAVVNSWIHGNDRSALVVLGCTIDQLANRELRH
jgi:hypothetical protein